MGSLPQAPPDRGARQAAAPPKPSPFSLGTWAAAAESAEGLRQRVLVLEEHTLALEAELQRERQLRKAQSAAGAANATRV